MMMRIVGQNSDLMFVQFNERGEWVQKRISYKEFEELMTNFYPVYVEEFKNSNTTQNMESYFYSYGEDISKDTYIFV